MSMHRWRNPFLLGFLGTFLLSLAPQSNENNSPDPNLTEIGSAVPSQDQDKPSQDQDKPSQDQEKLKPAELIEVAVEQLVKLQEESGRWRYAVLAENFNQRPGIQEGSTAIVAQALLLAAPDNPDAQAAVQKGLSYLLKQLSHEKMKKPAMDYCVYGHCFPLEFLCHVRARKAAGEHEQEVNERISSLVDILLKEQCPNGAWSYFGKPGAATFVTVPVTQALMLAYSQGEKIPTEVFQKGFKSLEELRLKSGAYLYNASVMGRFKQKDGTFSNDGTSENPKNMAKAESAISESSARRSANEVTLYLLGGGSIDAIQASLDVFYERWNDLLHRRGKTGTHTAPHGIAPYYFLYGHRYAAQAIKLLPEERRVEERERLLEALLKTRSPDGTWNDVASPHSRAYGTAMVVLALLGENTPMPPSMPLPESEPEPEPK